MATKEKPATQVTTGKVRLSYAHLFEPYAFEGQAAKYSTALLIPKSDTATLTRIKKAIEAAKETGKTKKWGGKIPAKLELPLRDGDEERPDDEAYVGHYFLNAKSDTPPAVVDYPGCNPITDRQAVESGDYARVSLSFFPYNKGGNNGVGCGLNNVQFLQRGEPLGTRRDPEADFAEEFEGGADFLD